MNESLGQINSRRVQRQLDIFGAHEDIIETRENRNRYDRGYIDGFDDLLKCPLCELYPRVLVERGHYYVDCFGKDFDHSVVVDGEYPEEIVKIWNRRPELNNT